MVITMLDEASYQRVARLDPDGQWELHDGELREKSMAAEHSDVMAHLGVLIGPQLPATGIAPASMRAIFGW